MILGRCLDVNDDDGSVILIWLNTVERRENQREIREQHACKVLYTTHILSICQDSYSIETIRSKGVQPTNLQRSRPAPRTFPLPLPLSAERVSESEIGLGSIKSVSSFPGLHLPVKIGATEPRRHVHPQLQSIGIKRKPSTTFRNELDSTELPFHLWTC